MKRSVATLAGFGAALLMVAMIGELSLSGRWPTDAPLEHPENRGILALPVDQVAAVEIAAGDKAIVFSRTQAAGWTVNGAPTAPAIAAHVETALRFLNVSTPSRVLSGTDYTDAQFAELGLDPPRMLASIVETGGKTTSVAFGEATPAQVSQYVRVTGQSRLYLLSRHVGTEWQLALDMAGRASAGETSAAGSTAQSSAFLLPVSLGEIGVVEIVATGALTRFERDSAGEWFHHVGQHAHAPGGFVHKADPKLAPLIAAELAALERAPVETVVARHADAEMLSGFGLEHPPLIMLLYTRDSSRPVARIEFGTEAGDKFLRYARVQESDTVVTVAGYEAAHLGKLLQLAGARS